VGTAPPAGSAGTGQSSAGASDAAPAEDEREVTTPEILSSLSVTVENPDILRVSIENESADRAKRIADAVVDAYLERSREAASEEAAKGEEFLLRQMEALKHDMERIEADTRKFKTSHNIRDPNLDSLVGPSAILDYSTEAERAQTDLQAAAAELASLQRRLQKESPVRVVRNPVNDPLAIGMRQAVTDAEVELAKLQAQYQDAHPLVRHQKAKLAELRAQLAAYDKPQELVESTEPNPMYEALQARIRDQQTAVESLRVRASMLAQLAAKKLAQKPPNSPDAFVGLLERLQELKIQKASEVGYARRLDWAQRPTYPIRPAPKRTLAMAAMIGLMLGVSVVFLMACTDTSVSDPKELLQRTGMVALGFIPEGSRREVSAAAYVPT
jgi:succinoglycan biosynthesis transport protein ExoP